MYRPCGFPLTLIRCQFEALTLINSRTVRKQRHRVGATAVVLQRSEVVDQSAPPLCLPDRLFL